MNLYLNHIRASNLKTIELSKFYYKTIIDNSKWEMYVAIHKLNVK